ncbi:MULTISPECIES: MEKHLA domain-containing protein [Pseudanabaena]|uniref:MEKHLA domain-containing protein n=1 Tax=Pseudanabaena TaxID=1152 RepID=UPI00247A2959|nr:MULTISPECIES: MEKHLA domain-containing protein [Pseudanabaena]MEA5487835.1 MEKHLA domain-containing protein [Pseudanabaena sp. CCNP1317]WGS74427.1 MEKHLA domain-containing protein [Pseudanabaena galeata CCNP1313]
MNTNQSPPWLKRELLQHIQLLLYSFHHWTGRPLMSITDHQTPQEIANLLFNADFVVVSHGTQIDPILNYGNQKALDLWKMDWTTFTATPSRYTAEPMERSEREQLLSQAKSQGYISDYRGIRIASTGDRFYIDQAIIWNVVDSDGKLWGQAATFRKWEAISSAPITNAVWN